MEHLTYIVANPINTGITLYHKTYDKVNRLEKWQRYTIPNVFMTGGKGASFNKGYDNANDVKIRVWKNDNNLTNIPFVIGDIVVKGLITLNITTQADLKAIPDVYNITSIVDNNTDDEMSHIKLGGK